jgi:hypothetical protein
MAEANRAVLGTIAVLLVSASAGAAQQVPRASQRGTVSQTVGATLFSIVYDRPVARARTLFGPGGVVPYGREWTPGANRATTLEITGDVLVERMALPAGKYSIWAVPQAEEWTIVFSKANDVFHIPYPAGQDVLRVKVRTTTGNHMETLAYYFPIVGPDSTVMHIHWGTVVVPVTFHLKKE